MSISFIFMLTRDDRTVDDAERLVATAIGAGIQHIGFKDIGLPFDDLQRITQHIKNAKAAVYLEVVSLDAASEERSARAAVALGVDVLMGGCRPELVVPILAGTGIRYFPFPGRIEGHPSRLLGTIETIAASARDLAGRDGVHGLDLLAYRFDGDVTALTRAVVAAAAGKPVVAAGSIDRAERISAMAAAGVTAFTVGTAAIDGVFPSGDVSLSGQLSYIMKAAKGQVR